MILQGFYTETKTSYDILGPPRPPRTSQDLLRITMISYDFIMILALFYKETMTSYDILGPPRTYKDLLGISIISYDFTMILQ